MKPVLTLPINLQRLKDWTGAVFLTTGAQAAVQLLAFASGLLVIRSLDAEQYAYYTIANAALGAMTVLTDGGVIGGVLSQGGKVWHDRAALGGVIAAGLALRRRFALVVLSFSVPLMFLLLRHQGAGIAEATNCDCPPSRCGGTTMRRATWLAIAEP